MFKRNLSVAESEVVINKDEFQTKVRELSSLEAGRTDADYERLLANRNRLVSSIGGVAELQSLEGDWMTLNIYRDNPVLDFVEMRDLPLGSIPFYRTRTENPVGVFVGSLAGHGVTNYYSTVDTAVQVGTFTVQTEEVMVPNLNQIYDMAKLEQRKVALNRLAMAMKTMTVNIAVNAMLGASDLVNTDPAAQIATYFAGGGSFAGKNVYALDPGVVANGVPSVNVYDFSAELGLTKRVFQALNTHSIQIGRRIRKILVPNAATAGNGPVWEALQNQASIVALVSGQGNANPAKAIPTDKWNEFQRDDFRGSVSIDWFGQSIEIERLNWLPAGYAIVLTDQPAVIWWDRMKLATGEQAEGTLETPVNAYYAKRSEARNIGVAQPTFLLRNFLVLKLQ